MNKIFFTLKALAFSGILFTIISCDNIMSVDSDRYMSADENLLNSPNDTVYSVLGILNKVQQLADKYVLMGELRGDLLDVTDNTEKDIRSLNDFSVDKSSSQFSETRDFYAVINNCNYFINRADTNISVRGVKSFVREYNAVKTIRAWTYLQLGLNYGQATYFHNPILTVNDLKKEYQLFQLPQLIDTLIAEMKSIYPLVNTELPGYGSINGANSDYLFVSARFLLGDLYLWKASMTKNITDYENAALYYSELIDDDNYFLTGNRAIWSDNTFKSLSDGWSSIFSNITASRELISIFKLTNSTYSGTKSQLNILSRDEKLIASDNYKKLAEEQVYCFRETSGTLKFTLGDLRYNASVMSDHIVDSISNSTDKKIGAIVKYKNNNIIVYRKSLLYLRYAEAVNRAGKPSLAFAVLKYGLNDDNLKNSERVAPGELADGKSYHKIFEKEKFIANVGVHAHGTGNADFNPAYIIPDFTRYETLKDIQGNDSIVPTADIAKLVAARRDSIMYVESAICDEAALETAMEGNRFQDLMRISNHRDDPSFLAGKVADKHKENRQYYYDLLQNKNNWFIPIK